MALLETVEIEPRQAPADAAVIWMHGLGADGHDFPPIVPLLGLEHLPLRFVFPHAPVRPVTINGGMRMRAWYDILGMQLESRQDEAGILDSCARVAALIERETERGVAPERIVLAGFSQGGAIALHLGLRHGQRLAGIVALSTYLVRGRSLATERSPANRDVPIFQAHGSLDPMVQHARGQEARAALVELGYPVEWHAYPMGHQVCEEEIADLGEFLRRCFEA
jgi:phospholipase/carboxylesterase